MMYNIKFSKQANKYIRKQDKVTQRRLLNAIIEIGENPYSVNNVKKLKGTDLVRKRVGDIRIIYDVIEDELVIYVLKIDNRGQVYK